MTVVHLYRRSTESVFHSAIKNVPEWLLVSAFSVFCGLAQWGGLLYLDSIGK
jgi:hypothetical protein